MPPQPTHPMYPWQQHLSAETPCGRNRIPRHTPRRTRRRQQRSTRRRGDTLRGVAALGLARRLR
eukprot:5530358-Prymnesium_polylepis.1